MAIVDRRGVEVAATDPAIGADPNPGLAIKAPVRAATTDKSGPLADGNIVLEGLQTIDSVALEAGNRVLVKNQTDATQNGIYNASSGPWTRGIDMRGNDQVANGLQVLVTDGSVNVDSVFVLTCDEPVVIGTSLLQFISTITPDGAIEFQIFGGGTSIGAGIKRGLELPWQFTIEQWTIDADRIGNISIDLWVGPYASLPLSIANSIVSAAPPKLIGTQKAQSSILTGWSPQLNKHDWIYPVIAGGATVQEITLSLHGSRP